MLSNQQFFFTHLSYIVCLITRLSVLTAQTPDDVLERIVDDIYKAAPYNRFCNRTEPTMEKSFFSFEYPCMLQCSCNQSTCWEKLPCCPDIPEPRPERRRNSSCHYPVVYSEPLGPFNHPQKHVDFPIRMVHDCEERFIASELHRKCLMFRQFNTTDIKNLVPVVSEGSGIVYANRFCAECSGTEHYQTFKTEFICWNRLLQHNQWELLALEWSKENRIRLIEAGMCNYVFHAPRPVEMENNRCMDFRYTSCNQTGKWEVNDPFLEEACSAYELPYQDFYKNYHCMMCNTPSRYSSPENRHRINPLCYTNVASILEISFYSLISLDQSHLTGIRSAYLDKDTQGCRNMPHAVYDKHKDACRRTFCPLFHYHVDDRCYAVNNVNQMMALPKEAIILFQEVNKTEKIQDPYENFTTDILPIVTRNILIKLMGIETPARWTFMQKEGTFESDFVLVFKWVQSTDSESLVPEKIQKFFDISIVEIPFNGTSGLFKAVTLSNPYLGDIKVNGSSFKSIFVQRNFRVRTFGPLPAASLQMTKLVLCNRVVLDTNEFNITDEFIFLLSKKRLRVTDAHIVTDKGLHLCVDDYIDLTENVSVAEAKSSILQQITVILSFVCSIVSMLCLVISILTYILLKSLRTIPGKINLCLCISLLIAQILQQFTMDMTQYPTVCAVFGGLIHFSWATTLFWMNTASFNLFRCFSPANMAKDFKPSLLLYAVYVTCMSLLLVGSNVGYSLWALKGSVGYGGHICYITSFYGILITFVTPVGLIILANIIFLSVTVWRISQSPRPQGTKAVDRSNVLIYIKMSTLTGICWIFGFLRLWTEIEIFELLFVLTNASQGLLLMLSFVCNKRILDNFRELLSKQT